MKKDTLYYDSECPICSVEMAKLAKLKNDTLTLLPIVDADCSDSQRQALYQDLHIKKSDGTVLRGFDANIYAWQQTKYRRVASCLAVPPLSWLGKLGYAIWLTYYNSRRKSRHNG